MTDEFLTQDEVDALLQGVPGEPPEEPAPPGQGDIRRCDLATQERVVRWRMPALDGIHARFCANLRPALGNYLRRPVKITPGALRTQKYGEFVRTLPLPPNLNLVRAQPLAGVGLFVFEPALIGLVVDALFGSDGRFQPRVDAREFTPTEQRIIQRLLTLVLENYEKAWQPVRPLKLEFVRSETSAHFAAIAAPNEIVVVLPFAIEIGPGLAGALHVCLPYTMLEPLRDILECALPGEKPAGQDRSWANILSQQLQDAEVELVANLLHIPVTLQQILGMKAGDVISVEPPELIIAEVDGVPVMECHYGKFNGQYALKVARMVNRGAPVEAVPHRAGVTPLH